MDGDNENQEDDLDRNSEYLGNWLRKRASEASVYVSAENIAPTEGDDFKSTTQLYPKISDEPSETPNNKRSPTKSNSSVNESPNKVDTLVLRSTGKYSKPHETIKLEHLLKPDGDTASLLSIESAVFFDDHVRRIDFVLVYSIEPADNGEHHVTARKIFENNLKAEGLELEHVYQAETGLVYVKIHAPWEILSRYGEILKFKMPMKESLFELPERTSNNVPDFDFSKYYFRNLFNRMTGLAQSVSDLMHPEAYTIRFKDCHFSTVYSRDKEYLFDIPRKKEDFFSPAQRSRIVQFILKRKSFTEDHTDIFGFGIKKLLADGVYTAAYPLHEGDLNDESPGNPRWFLQKNWASYSCLFKTQPLDEIKHYFGVKIGLYFAWLGFYTYMLIPASIVGILCFIYGCLTLETNVPSNEICNSNFVMCPRCDKECHYWVLKESCKAAKITYLVDNAATVFFAIFMSLWGAVFLEMWKRYSADITHRWDLTGFDTSEEHPRPEYLARLANERRKKLNFITRMYEPYVPFWRKRLPYSVMSTSIVLLLVMVALAAVVGVILYRISVNASLLLSKDKNLTNFASIITSTTAALLNLICIMIFNQFYTFMATYLTELELHRTQTEFDDSLTLKMFLLQFVNYYSSIFYIAFFKGKLIGHPGRYNLLFGLRQEECGTGGCLMELAIQLAIIMVGKQALNNLMEVLWPWLIWVYQRWQIKKRGKSTTSRWEEDYALAEWGPTHLFFEYLEMILQFGFVTIFVAAFPLAPLFALLNNIFEIRLDAHKLVFSHRRPVGVRVQNIGIWYRILDSIGKLAVLTNGIIIAFTSDMIPRLVYRIAWSPDYSLHGFVNYSLSYFNTSHFPDGVDPQPLILPGNKDPVDVEVCRYRDHRNSHLAPEDERYNFNEEYWHLLAVRFAFVLMFENIILMITTFLRWLIPDVPKKLMERIRHENFITNEIMIAQELRRAKGLDTIPEEKSNGDTVIANSNLATPRINTPNSIGSSPKLNTHTSKSANNSPKINTPKSANASPKIVNQTYV
ncbi:anoctamin-5-like isoform X1 [Argiope bruennichi]|uniref:anoctamin-5-like isoform X1 n=1 Tax=Argiope bruennichi TaxID=94029 RepID=UPI00249464AC|nr:anoctamin-5-like isoform X1 [Argiope bruennichi]XP_055925698.1 anoctamin-5-like isoform X1 [Argiope bruennichi]